MAEIKITYESLFDILRREKSREELQKLDPTFYDDVLVYLQQKQDALQQKAAAGVNIEQDGTRNHTINVKKILREIYERRERKIVSMAVHRSRLGENAVMDTSTLLAQERQLYEKFVQMLLGSRKDVLEAVLERRSPRQVQERAVSEEQTETTQTSEPQPVAPSETMRIRFIKAVPKFLGRNMEVHGPFEENDVAELPNMIAQLLVSKGRAEKVDAE
jgi:DNA replication initiation complex subunit (GINS family)